MLALLRPFLWPFLYLLFGVLAISFLCPIEAAAVHTQIIGYPDSVLPAYQLRPWLLGILLFIPFIASLIYHFSDTLDKYTLRTFLSAFSICFSALFIILFLEDIQDNLADFKQNEEMWRLMGIHYLTKLPALLVFMLPYSLMLALLWALGKMSKNQEIVAMIQTGRSIPRIVRPLIIFGFLCAIICAICNYHWAPYAESQEKNILSLARGESVNEAKHVAYQNDSNQRHWYVGAFPAEYNRNAPLQSVSISHFGPDKKIHQRILTNSAKWNIETRQWTLEKPLIYTFDHHSVEAIKHEKDLVTDWSETPHQIINPGLKPSFLSIPGILSWIANHRDHPLSDKRSYLTYWHYRLASPFICMITILLAAPLGIVLNRRSLGGGVAIAIFLCAGMVFCSTVFPTLGESGHLPPIVAAWSTNIIFTLIALLLFYRRTTGRPIYQVIKNWLDR